MSSGVLGVLLVLDPGLVQARGGGDDKDHDDDAEGQQRRDLRHRDVLAAVDERQLVLVQRVQDQLHADEGEDDRQPLRQVDQSLQQVAEQEVELPQTHQREHVGGEHQVRLLGEAVDRRDRVQREDQVGGAEGDDDEEHRRHQPLAVLLHPELEPVPLVGQLQVSAGEPHHEVVRVVVVVGVARQRDRRVEQERAENVEHPGELVDRDRAERDEDAAEDQRQDDADQKRLLLILLGHVEAGHDDQEDEQVVDRQAVLGEPAGEELDAELAAVEEVHPDAEGHREPDVDRQRRHQLTLRRFMRPSADDHDVEQQDSDRHGDRDDPLELGNLHLRCLRSSKRPRSLPPSARPAGRSSDDSRRDDDTAAKEYSPRHPVCQKAVGDAQLGPTTRCATMPR